MQVAVCLSDACCMVVALLLACGLRLTSDHSLFDQSVAVTGARTERWSLPYACVHSLAPTCWFFVNYSGPVALVTCVFYVLRRMNREPPIKKPNLMKSPSIPSLASRGRLYSSTLTTDCTIAFTLGPQTVVLCAVDSNHKPQTRQGWAWSCTGGLGNSKIPQHVWLCILDATLEMQRACV